MNVSEHTDVIAEIAELRKCKATVESIVDPMFSASSAVKKAFVVCCVSL
jgi:hypothetical protein